jgi:hypothetical protein
MVAALERRVGALYDRWAEIFRHLPLVADFWREMAGEERLHALIVGAAREVFPATALALPGGWSEQLTKVGKLLAVIEANTVPGLSLEEAFAQAEELETSELDTVTGLIIRQAGARFSRLAPLVNRSGLDRHRERMVEAHRRFCTIDPLRVR